MISSLFSGKISRSCSPLQCAAWRANHDPSAAMTDAAWIDSDIVLRELRCVMHSSEIVLVSELPLTLTFIFLPTHGGTLYRIGGIWCFLIHRFSHGAEVAIDFRSVRTMHASLMRRYGARLEVARDNMGHAGSTGSITLDVYRKPGGTSASTWSRKLSRLSSPT